MNEKHVSQKQIEQLSLLKIENLILKNKMKSQNESMSDLNDLASGRSSKKIISLEEKV